MTETYTNGTWLVKDGEEDAFVEEWTHFVNWGRTHAGSGTFRLVRDHDRPERYMSFADWESYDAQKAWKSEPEFPDRIGRVRGHCTDFQPSVFELVTRIDS
ncbi:MAG TPA: antibiotic biosynthesis monooxygenase [Gaiellaceae bacterium]|jgi:heme-degrading monooxygenase HmoA